MRPRRRSVPDGNDVTATMRPPFWARIVLIALAIAPHAVAAQTPPYVAVLIAGERDVPVFDRATAAMQARLQEMGAAKSDITRLSATPVATGPDPIALATLGNVSRAIAVLSPAVGQTCFVYITSHGGPRLGLVLAPRGEFLNPKILDRALNKGCKDAPAVVIASGCYSGDFARRPMARDNRIVLTAARANRPSFGCGADFDFTVYDQCLLAAMTPGTLWRDAYDQIRRCVRARERDEDFPASGPQAWFGVKMRDAVIGQLP